MNLLPPTESKQLKQTAQGALHWLDLELGGLDLNPQSTPRALLPALAFELDVEIQGLSEAEQRALLSSALEIRYGEGTLHATALAVQAVFGTKATLRRWFEEGAYIPVPHHFDIVIDFDEAFPAESFLGQIKKIKALLRFAKKVSAHFHFYAETILPEAPVKISAGAVLDWHLEQTTPLFHAGMMQPIAIQGAVM